MTRDKTYTISKRKKKGGWKAKESKAGVIATADNKEDIVQAIAQLANLQEKATLRIEKEDGEVQEERTYPRGAGTGSTPG